MVGYLRGGGCLSIHGLAGDARQREVHILFSACAGFLASTLAGVEKGVPGVTAYAHFDSEENAQKAGHARQGTSWVEGGKPIIIRIAQSGDDSQRRERSESPGRADSPMARQDMRAERMGRSLSPKAQNGISRGYRSRRTLDAIPTCQVSNGNALTVRARLAHATETRKIPELKAALAEAELCNLGVEELEYPEMVLGQETHRLNAHRAASASHKAIAKLSQVLNPPEEKSIRKQRVEACDAVKAGLEAVDLCELAGLQRKPGLSRSIQLVRDHWRDSAWEGIQDAMRKKDLESLKVIVTGCRDLGVLDDAEKMLQNDPHNPFALKKLQHLEVARRISEGQSTFQAEQRWERAQMDLDQALADNARTIEIKNLLERAEAARQECGIEGNSEFLDGIARRVGHTRDRHTIRWGLIAATVVTRVTSVYDILEARDRLQRAMNVAHEAGIMIEHVEPYLNLLDQEEVVATKLKWAAASGTDNLAKLKQAVANAQRLCDHHSLPSLLSLLEAARNKLGCENSREGARGKLADTSKKRGTQQIRDMPKMIQHGKAVGLSKQELEQASRSVGKSMAATILKKAAEGTNARAPGNFANDVAELLREATGDDAESRRLVTEALQGLGAESLLATMHDMVAMRNLSGLHEAIVLWDQKGFDRSFLQEAKGILQHLKDKQSSWLAAVSQQITFELDDVVPTQQGSKVLDAVAATLEESPGVRITIEGYSTHANATVAKRLTTRRAERVVEELQHRGVHNPMAVKAFGNVHAATVRSNKVKIVPHNLPRS